MRKHIAILGCGSDIRPDNDEEHYIHLDIKPQKDIVRDWDISNLDGIIYPETLDKIIAKDCLEHINYTIVDEVLANWISKLKSGGELWIRTPDIARQIYLFNSHVWPFEVFQQKVLGEGNQAGDVHQAFFTMFSLSEKLTKLGMKIVLQEYEDKGITGDLGSWNANIIVVSQKP